MTSQRWMLAFCFLLASVFNIGESITTTDTQKFTCRTYGSGVFEPFNGSNFYIRSNCPFTLTRFTNNRVGCDITVRRGDNGLLVQLDIIINKVRTVVQNGSVMVEEKSISLPYDHTYQHIFHYGIYTRLRSSLLPLSVTWRSVPGGIDAVQVELEQKLSTDTSGLCGKHTVTEDQQQLITESVIPEDACRTRDPVSKENKECRTFLSYTLDCLQAQTPRYIRLCEENIYRYEGSEYIGCAFFKEIVRLCGKERFIWHHWRSLTKCEEPSCPGSLVYTDEGQAFLPSCSNPNPTPSNQELISSCVCPEDEVLSDRADGFHCVPLSDCSCVFAGRSFINGDIRSTKCQSCMCEGGKWRCSENLCPAGCVIEGQFVTTFDGKQYVIPGKCSYVAAQCQNWALTIEYSEKSPSLKAVILQLFKDTYTFAKNTVTFGGEEITELHQSDHALVFWQSSMYVQVHTSFGMNFQVQMSPEIQLYVSATRNHTGLLSGLCGNNNDDTTDDFTTSSGIIENSAQPFSRSWSVGPCGVDILSSCSNTDAEMYADDKCSVLNNPTGIFAECHGHMPTDHYHTACVQRTCNCGRSVTQCLCAALGSYAKACAALGVVVGDWRKATNCTVTCQKNLEFSYNMRTCNHTCRSLSGADPRCGPGGAPVEGCGCPEGTHLNNGQSCTPKAECPCYHHDGAAAPGPVIIDGRKCVCEDGELHCAQDCGCTNGKVCVHCSEKPMNTAQKTCDDISRPTGASQTCESGCYCPDDQYEDHHGNCVSVSNCTCVYSGKVFSAGQQVRTNCKTCVCGQGQWLCRDQPCPGQCQVYGSGHYRTFDSKWYRFAGQCQYTLVEDDCGNRNGSFSVRVESVPCCDEALTCSRSIILDLQGKVTLTLSDMKVTRRLHDGWTVQEGSLYSTHTLGLYIVISVPSRGITLIWDKHTRLTVELHEHWRNRVCGLCGNFDSNEMNDLLIGGSAVSSPLAFGNSWRAATPPCSDVTTDIFPCERNSYCSAWAQRRCMILTGDTFKDCHLKVDPEPYYHACVQESCSCEFEGKFLGFCTAVAAYAEACSDQDACVKWRTPDLCPVYCDYYNEQGQCSWHYEACGEMLSCGKDDYITHKLEGCYPRCPKEEPYYDENTGECTKLRNCTCYFNGTIIQPWAAVMMQDFECRCENGQINCPPPPTTTATTNPTSSTPTTASSTTAETQSTTHPTTTSSTPMTTIPNISTTTEHWSTELSTTSTPTTTTSFTTTETRSIKHPPTTTSTPMTTIPNISTTMENWPTELSTTSIPTTTTPLTTAETQSTTHPTTTTSTQMTTIPNISSTTENWSTELWSTELSTTSTSITTTSFTMAETQSTKHPTTTTSTPMTTSPNTSTTMENWSTELYTMSTPTTRTTSEVTTSSPDITTIHTTPSLTMAASTQITMMTDSTKSTTVQMTSTEFPTSEPLSTVLTTSYTSHRTLSTDASTTGRTEPQPTETVMPTETIPTQSTTTHREPTATQLRSTTFATNAETSGPTVVTITEPHTDSLNHYMNVTTQPSTTASEATSTFTTMPPTTYTTEVSSSSTTVCECKDLKRKKRWDCGETWTEDCFHKTCADGKIELTSVVCPKLVIPNCPRNQSTKVLDGCCETWKCDCRCELYGDPHYISFQGVSFDFMLECTNILVEERSPHHNLTIAVENENCVEGLRGSCVKTVILTYHNNTATLSILPTLQSVQATLNNVTIEPPYEEYGFRFETTTYTVSLYLPEIRSFVSLSSSYILVVNLAMEHFFNKTQGQCGVCGVGSCIRKGGQMEDDSCCDKTAYGWVSENPLIPACASPSRSVPCLSPTTVSPPTTTVSSCPGSSLCELLDHPAFSNCSEFVNLKLKKQNCEYDSCRNGPCSSLEQAAMECMNAGSCVDWRALAPRSCPVTCPRGLVFRECHDKLDDFCYGGTVHPGAALEKGRGGCFCPSGQIKSGNHSNICVLKCAYCKGPLGEPKLPGEEWHSNCHVCTCNNQTRSEECVPRPLEPVLQCGPSAVLVNTPCCKKQICVEKTCSHNEQTYQVGDRWKDADHPCMSFHCIKEGIHTETRVCPEDKCPEEDRIWDDQHCCFTCNQSCVPRVTAINVTISNCTALMQVPMCQGHCESEPSVVLRGDLLVTQKNNCCRTRSSVNKRVTLQCSDLTARSFSYQHVTGCDCKACDPLP
ncbi:mucin-2-like [Pseudoliparis swirei]|uniref:mucin-2-like n=1 Tax=Pseudoliparis swirei TaxID=2059687 RepID=UPI0024BE5B54|nr:mucin-2-like [Pseudoliparis swirei]